jgi:hypothetical protein
VKKRHAHVVDKLWIDLGRMRRRDACVEGTLFFDIIKKTIIHKQGQSAGTRPEMEKPKLLAGLRSDTYLGRTRPADTLLHFGAGVKTGKFRSLLNIVLSGDSEPSGACRRSSARNP